jgi:hypothetical protein
MPDDFNPLTEHHLTDMNDALKKIDIARKQIDMAKRANISTGDLEDKLTATETQLRSIKQVYFPGR